MLKFTFNQNKLRILINRTYLAVLIILLFYLFLTNLNIIYDYKIELFNSKINEYLILLIYCIFTINIFVNISKVVSYPYETFVLSAIMIISTTLNGRFSINIFIANTLWLVFLYLAFILIKTQKEKIIISYLIFAFLILLFFLYLGSHTYSAIDPALINSVYYIVLLLPFILSLKNKIVSFIGVMIIISASIISLKRTALIAVTLSILIYFLISYKIQDKLRINMIIIICIFIVSLFYLYNYLVGYYHLDLIQRFQSLQTDGGSNRDVIYKALWTEQTKSNIIEWIIGRGHEGVFLKSGIGNSAHNDFLEILYDYGISGLIAYFTFILKLILVNLKMIKINHKLSAAFSASIALFLTISMFSHLIIIPSYFLALCCFWGISLNEYEVRKLQ